MRAAIYARQSKDRAGNELAVSRQLEDCRKICAARRWDAVEFIENNVSASKGRRPVYEAMLADVRDGKIGAVVAWDADRLTRQPRELEDFIDIADRHGLALATVGGDFDLSSPTGRGNARMRGVFARMEMEQKSARQQRSAKQHAESGGGWGGRRAFGYTKRDNLIDKDEAKLIRKAYTSILAGESLYSIAAQWNSAGVKTTVGNAWTGSTVRQVLVNPRYAGKRAYKGDVVAEAAWKPLVDVDVWQSVHDILTDEHRRRGGGVRSRLLTGILECGRCGSAMGSGVASDGSPTYVCKQCHRLSRRLRPVDKLVVDLAVGFLSRPDSIVVLIKEERTDTAELREQERAILEQLEKVAADRYDPDVDLSAAQFKAANDRLNARLKDVRGGMRDSNRVRVFDGLEEAIAKGVVRAWWDGLGLDRQRAILPLLFRVTLKPMGRGRPFDRSHVDVEWLTGDD
ncbi:DNA invertase Pin-like site-specific DNA recombinase [Mycolicibacterium iranicum]|uniref:DNA invertase Pin-like site-specific DNA recombinase n=1 Tax=Mycolicibacterium iranicum TaxID=912594 RepID=A0A839Q8Q4_MYCIR|nr:recombinase family protein [Mycolicibacterium iranicum]MBB2992370.1 DNA invertase Pin-like site-specific DNA recombinase [Mycolicibacterium iranicum]